MKKLTLSVVAVLAMSTFAVAGGDFITPVEPVIEMPMAVAEASEGAFYLGLAYGAANYDVEGSNAYSGSIVDTWSKDANYDTVMLQAGYKFNPYIAVEGRYWIGLDEDICDDQTLNVDTWGLYVKPMYPVTDAFDIYALLGYASSDLEISGTGAGTYSSAYDMDGFSWGIGSAYTLTENLSLFVDYTSLYDDNNAFTDIYDITVDEKITSWNFGVTYTF